MNRFATSVILALALPSLSADVAQAGMLYVTEFNGAIARYDTTTETSTIFAESNDLPAGLAFDSTGDVFAARLLTGAVIKYSPSGVIAPDGTRAAFATTASSPFDLAIAPSAMVPEPSSLALCGVAGLIGLVVARVRRSLARRADDSSRSPDHGAIDRLMTLQMG